jgi:hypothetical protein
VLNKIVFDKRRRQLLLLVLGASFHFCADPLRGAPGWRPFSILTKYVLHLLPLHGEKGPIVRMAWVKHVSKSRTEMVFSTGSMKSL